MVNGCDYDGQLKYRKAGKFGGLAVYATAKLKICSYLHIYAWWSLTEPPNLNLPIFLKWRFGAEPPNLIPANISSYTVHYCEACKLSHSIMIQSIIKPVFCHIEHTVLTTRSGAQISRFGDYCVHDNDEDRTDYFTSCACARGNNLIDPMPSLTFLWPYNPWNHTGVAWPHPLWPLATPLQAHDKVHTRSGKLTT